MKISRLMMILNFTLVSIRRIYSGMPGMGSKGSEYNSLFQELSEERSDQGQPKYDEHSYLIGMALHFKNEEIKSLEIEGEDRLEILRKLVQRHDVYYFKKDLSEISEDTIKTRLKAAKKRHAGSMSGQILKIMYRIAAHKAGLDRIKNGDALKLENKLIRNSSSFKAMIEMFYDYSVYSEEQRQKLIDHIRSQTR